MKKLIAVVAVILLMATVTLNVYLLTRMQGLANHIELLQENAYLKELLLRESERYGMRTQELCEIRVRLGHAYREAFDGLIRRLGLRDRPVSAAAMVLDNFGGMGGE